MDIYKKKREEFLDASIGETHDMRVLFEALKKTVRDEADLDYVIQSAWEDLRVDAELQAAFDRREYAEAQARQKAAKSDKKQGELEGQLKLKLNDDGTEAEAATEVAVFSVSTAIEQIEAIQNVLGLSDATVDDMFSASAFDGAKTPEEQPEVYKSVLDILVSIECYRADLSQAAEVATKCSPEILVAVREFIEKDDAEAARALLVHHFTEVVQATEPNLDAGSVLFYCRNCDSNQPEPLIDAETIEAYARLLLAARKKAEAAPAAVVEVLPEAPEALPWEDLVITPEDHKLILDHFVDGEPVLGKVKLDELISAQFAEATKAVQGLILEKHIERFDKLAEPVAEPEQAPAPEPEEPQNDLEKAAAKKKAAGKKAAKK